MALPLPLVQLGETVGLIFFTRICLQISRAAFFYLHNNPKMRSILSQSDAEKLVHVFVTMNYCNAILLDCPRNSLKIFKLIQNAVARVLPREIISLQTWPLYTGFL